MSKSLLIVESPAKCKTISRYLGNDFAVLASFGHIRDLGKGNKAVDVDNDFAMDYTLIERNVQHVNALIREAKKADTIYLATDLDREGEAISWHILEVLKERGLTKGKTFHRVVFSEITQKAVKHAVANPRELSMPMVNAQQARRALDYLVGFTLSPVLWRKVHKGLSAGRVQSPALRMIVERDEAIQAFDPKEYWTLNAELEQLRTHFQARLTHYHGQKLGQFDLNTKALATEAEQTLLKHAGGQLTVTKVESKERHRRPAPPFTTSTLQQEAARKLGFATSKTMRTAQGLYEGVSLGAATGNVGLITYMRTDALALSADAVTDIRSYIAAHYTADCLPGTPQVYVNKSKNAQEAHEAIRPSSITRTPESIKAFLDHDQYRLYELIWKRTMACQMSQAVMATTSVEFRLPKTPGGEACFRANGSVVVVPGFLTVYEEGKDTKSDEDETKKLPHLVEGDVVKVLDIMAEQHYTEPPARFTEAALVKAMEEFGIGRPSTYAAIIHVLQQREYVTMEGKAFMPTDIGKAVSHFLTKHFPNIVDYHFTAKLEDDLDTVATGAREWIPLLHQFWTPFIALVKEKDKSVERGEAMGARLLGKDPKTGLPVSVRIGKFGPVAMIGDTADKTTPASFAPLKDGQSIHSVTLDEVLDLFKLPRTLGTAENGDLIEVKSGRFGPFVKQGDIYASIPKDLDPLTITLEEALPLVAERKAFVENRVIKDFGGDLRILNGKYGPFCTDGKRNANAPKGKEREELQLMTKEECLAMLDEAANKPKGKWGGKPSGKGKPQKFHKKGSKPAATGGKPKDDLPM